MTVSFCVLPTAHWQKNDHRDRAGWVRGSLLGNVQKASAFHLPFPLNLIFEISCMFGQAKDFCNCLVQTHMCSSPCCFFLSFWHLSTSLSAIYLGGKKKQGQQQLHCNLTYRETSPDQ